MWKIKSRYDQSESRYDIVDHATTNMGPIFQFGFRVLAKTESQAKFCIKWNDVTSTSGQTRLDGVKGEEKILYGYFTSTTYHQASSDMICGVVVKFGQLPAVLINDGSILYEVGLYLSPHFVWNF